jgi:hypothetical protein
MKVFATLCATASLQLCFCCAMLVSAASAADGPCSLPAGLQEEFSKSRPGTTVARLANFSDDDKAFFSKEHPSSCPGLVKVDFYGDKKPTWAVVLIKGNGQAFNYELLVAQRDKNIWNLRTLVPSDSDTFVPFVWALGPGNYQSVSDGTTIHATRPVIVFFQYGAVEIVFSWNGTKIEKVWLMD